MTKSELKEIIKECLEEINESSVVEESADINSINEDSRIVDEAEYMDFMYNSILVETVVGEYDTFDNICKSVIGESFEVVTEVGRPLRKKIKYAIDRFFKWIKEKVIPFFRNIIPNILNKNIDRVKALAKAGKLQEYKFTEEDIKLLMDKFPNSDGNLATVYTANLINNANANFGTMSKLINDIENGKVNDIDTQLNILKQNSLFSDAEINSKSIKSDFMNNILDKFICVVSIDTGDEIDHALDIILRHIEALKKISEDIGKNADKLTKKINALNNSMYNINDADISRALSSCTRVINTYTEFMSYIVKDNTRYVNTICAIYDKHSKSDKDDK